MSRRTTANAGTAEHRPAARVRRFRHDDLVAVDLFSGFGGLTRGIERAGFTTIMAANHNRYKIDVHERNHPEAEHWIADLVDPESADYHSAADLPAADFLVAGVSCTNHSKANVKRAYRQGLTLFEMDHDEEYEENVTRSERDRATALCVLQYAERHRPRAILLECTTEFQAWGPALPGKTKIGDGTTYKWFLRQLKNMKYRRQIMFFNSMFFGVPQSRNRWFGLFTQESLPVPDVEHRPMTWCQPCDQVLPAVWTWKTGVPPSGSVSWGQQYIYTCPRCRREVVPPMTPSIEALDLSDLGPRIEDKPIKNFYNKAGELIGTGPMAPATMARGQRCKDRFGDFPAVLMPVKATRGVERTVWEPASTQTSQLETSVLSTGRPVLLHGSVFAAHRHNGDGKHITQPMDTVTSTHERALFSMGITNYQGEARGLDQALPTQGGSETMGLLSARVMPNRTNGTSRNLGQPMETVVGNAGSGGLSVLSTGILPFRNNTVPTVATTEAAPTMTADQIPGLITAAGTIKNNGGVDQAGYRAHPVSNPLGTIVAEGGQALMTSGWCAPDTYAQWQRQLAEMPLGKCHFRMLFKHEVGRSCGFDVDFPGHQGTFEVWGSARDQVDGFGNAVSPPIGEWIGHRVRAVLDPASIGIDYGRIA